VSSGHRSFCERLGREQLRKALSSLGIVHEGPIIDHGVLAWRFA
jgi:hypothetical protein